MRSFWDKENVIWVENVFSFENNGLKEDSEFEEIETDKCENELYSDF